MASRDGIMKITESSLRRIIREELRPSLNEHSCSEQYTRGYHDRDAWVSGLQEQGCGDREEGCVKRSDGDDADTYGPAGTYYILNNKKGGVWKKGYESEKSAKDSIQAMHSQNESLIKEENLKIPDEVKKKGVEVGMALLLSMIATTAGREKLASLLVAIPDFIKQYLCNLPSDWMQTSDGEKRTMLGKAYGMLCRFGVTVPFSPLYVLAWFLRLLSDDDAQVIITTVPKSEEEEEKKSPDSTDTVEELESIPPPAQWSPQDEPAMAESLSRNRMLILSGISPEKNR